MGLEYIFEAYDGITYEFIYDTFKNISDVARDIYLTKYEIETSPEIVKLLFNNIPDFLVKPKGDKTNLLAVKIFIGNQYEPEAIKIKNQYKYMPHWGISYY